MCMVDLHAAFYCLLVYALSLAIARCCCDDNVYLICEMRASYTLSDTSRLTTTSILDHGLLHVHFAAFCMQTRELRLSTRDQGQACEFLVTFLGGLFASLVSPIPGLFLPLGDCGTMECNLGL